MVGEKLLSHFEENFKSKPPFIPQDRGPPLPGSPLPRTERGHWVLTSTACAAGAAIRALSAESSPGRKTQQPPRCLLSCGLSSFQRHCPLWPLTSQPQGRRARQESTGSGAGGPRRGRDGGGVPFPEPSRPCGWRSWPPRSSSFLQG